MKLLFEEYSYDLPYVQKVSLSAYFFLCEELNSAQVPYVGYFYSEQAKDSVFILPKVFLFEGDGNAANGEIAFGKYRPVEIINVDDPNNPMHKDGFDKVVFSLSVWLYQSIQRYHARHKYSAIIENAKIQNVISNKGDSDQTFLDTMLSMLRFHKDHQNLFTYISIVNSSGNNKIHWGKTMSKVQPLIRNDVPFYAEFRNKNKTINYDEDIIILFYSALEYLKQKYCFPVNINLNYDIIKPRRVEDMIETGKGTRLLKSIRKKYFTDELVALWKLLYVFFQKAETIQKGRYHEEALLARSYNLVFEDMIDVLIGDDMPEISHLKDTKDGKRIDHIYKDDSLIPEEKIFFIGDSKYYFDDSEIVGESIHKQFTYAKNIIQYSLNIFQKPENKRNVDEKKVVKELRYRDELTEGYNITPNFFIRGAIKKEYVAGGKLNINDPGLEPDPQEFQMNRHFSNRLFDRDTLILQAYRINFLYVMASYARGYRNYGFKVETRRRFREDIIRTFNSRYDFYKITPNDSSPAGVEAFVCKHFKTLIGKIYRGSDNDTFIWLALERGDDTCDLLRVIRSDASITATKLLNCRQLLSKYMSDTMTIAQRHNCMSRIHSRDTTPSCKLRRALWHNGFRYRVNDKRLPGSPDIVLPKYHTVIFIHGCFWHGHKGCKSYTVPKTNIDFWTAKIARNQERDQEVWRQLEAKGWYVIIVWECQLKKAVLGETIRCVEERIHLNRQQYLKASEERKASELAYQHNRKAQKEKEAALMAELKGMLHK